MSSQVLKLVFFIVAIAQTLNLLYTARFIYSVSLFGEVQSSWL